MTSIFRSGNWWRPAAIAVLGAVLIGALGLASCRTESPEHEAAIVDTEQQPTAGNDQPPDESKALKVQFQTAQILWDDRDGKRIMEAKFEEATASQAGDESQIELRGVKAALFRDGSAVSSLDAPHVIADSRTREVRATGGVEIISTDGSSLRSQSITWKSAEDKLIGMGAVKLVKDNITITGNTLEADTALNRATMRNGTASLD